MRRSATIAAGGTGGASRRWRGVAAIGGFALAAYAALCVWFAVHQREFQYTLGGNRATPQEAGVAGFAAVEIPTEDGERLSGWWAPPPAGAGVVLFLHGTPGTVPDNAWRLMPLRDAGLGVLAIDYRGYGASTGRPTETGLRADARAAFDFVRRTAPQAKIAVFGESMGTGPAVGLANDRPVAGLLLNSPYASVRRLYELRGPPLPYRLILADQYDAEALIRGITAPLMILAGTADEATPIGEARRLFAAARGPKTMIEAEGMPHLMAFQGDNETAAIAALRAWTAAPR